MGERGPQHTFKSYPEELQEAIDQKIRAGVPYRDIAGWINNMAKVEQGEMKGTSVAGVSRYASNFKEKLEHSRRLREQVKAVIDNSKDGPNTDMVEAGNTLAIEMLIERLMSADIGELEEASLLKVIKSITDLQRAAVTNERLKMLHMKYQADIEDKRKLALDEFKSMAYTELSEEYPEVYEKLVQIAEQSFRKIELQEQK